VLTAVEFEVLWEWLRLGPIPAVLRLDSPCRTHEERARVVLGGWQGMRERGLADSVGAAPGLVRVLGVLAAPVESAELRMWIGRSVRAVAAARHEVRVVAVRQDETVCIRRTDSLAGGLARVLPAASPAPALRTRGQISALAADRHGVLRRLPAVRGVIGTSTRSEVARAVEDLLAAARRAAAHACLAG
jgi:ESX secretion-associated protein EspG